MLTAVSVPHQDFSDLYEKMSGEGECAPYCARRTVLAAPTMQQTDRAEDRLEGLLAMSDVDTVMASDEESCSADDLH